MIEVNLLPGASRRSSRRSIRLSGLFSSLGKGPSLDRTVAFIAGGWIIGPAAIAWLFLGASSRIEELDLAIEQAVQDSARYARLIETQERLRARRDSVAQKLEIIQAVDAGRYIWAHLMDEVSRALPEYTWLTRLQHMQGEEAAPTFQLTGHTGNTFALTRFMKDLEASPFIRTVQLTTTEQVGGPDGRPVHQFILTAQYEEPPPELIETVSIIAIEEE